VIFIETLLRDLLPELCSSNPLSIACLSTSNPVYLVFTKDESYPAFVVRISESEEIRSAHLITEKLYEIAGDLVSQPLLLSRNDSRYISIQTGLKGSPWFQIANKYSNPDQWHQFKLKTINSLAQLHHAIANNPQWSQTCEPGRELRQCYKQCIDLGTTLPDGTAEQVSILSAQLDESDIIGVRPQHGDFCINNLIIENEKMHVIDFEDFGITNMPLHDEFTLALSMYQLLPEAAQTSLREDIALCTSDSIHQLNIKRYYLPGLFMHHLLLRLGAWSENRRPYREWLLMILKKFIASPDSCFKN